MADWLPVGPVRRRASVTLNGITPVSGSVTSPTTFQIFLTTGSLPAGTYTVNWSVTVSGTIGANEANNFALVLGSGPLLAQSVNPAVAGTYQQAPVTVTIGAAGDVLTLKSWSSTPTTGAVYSGTVSTTGNGSVSFDVFSANHRWVIDTVFCTTSQAQTTAPYPQVIAYIGGMQAGVAEGASWVGNQTTLHGPQELTAADTLNVQFNGGAAASVATVVIEGSSYLWR